MSINLYSCASKDIQGERCQESDNLKKVLAITEIDSLPESGTSIYFRSHDSWGTFNNEILLVYNNKKNFIRSEFISNNIKKSISDTTKSIKLIDKLDLEDLIDRIDALNCKPHSIDPRGNCCDSDYHEILIKEGNKIRGWMWDGDTISITNVGNRFNDLNKHKALEIEGILYRLGGYNETKLYYATDGECVNDSIKVFFTKSKNTYQIKSFEPYHPNFEFDEYLRTKIPCADTLSFSNDLVVTLTTKENEKRTMRNLSRHKLTDHKL